MRPLQLPEAKRRKWSDLLAWRKGPACCLLPLGRGRRRGWRQNGKGLICCVPFHPSNRPECVASNAAANSLLLRQTTTTTSVVVSLASQPAALAHKGADRPTGWPSEQSGRRLTWAIQVQSRLVSSRLVLDPLDRLSANGHLGQVQRVAREPHAASLMAAGMAALY